MTTIWLKTRYCNAEVTVDVGKYENGRIALSLHDTRTGEPVLRATTNIPEIDLAEDEVIIKMVDENEGVLDQLVVYGIVEDTGKRISNRFQKSAYAICRLTPASQACEYCGFAYAREYLCHLKGESDDQSARWYLCKGCLLDEYEGYEPVSH